MVQIQYLVLLLLQGVEVVLAAILRAAQAVQVVVVMVDMLQPEELVLLGKEIMPAQE
jgi:hypothetical protein